MKKYNYWRGFTLALLVLVYVNLFFMSKEVIYKGYVPTDNYNATFEIDVCFRSYISENYCHSLAIPPEDIPKEFNCSFKDRIGCYTKGFDQMNVSEIIRKFQGCNLTDLAEVKSERENVTKTSTEILLFRKFVCTRHKFQVHEKNESSQFSISTKNKNQPFKVYVTYGRDYESDGKYKTKSTNLFERACWVEPGKQAHSNESLKCTETDKEIVISVEYYSAKYLEYPFNTDCVYRKDPKRSTQNDCYESCVKEKVNYHLLTYKEDENVQLVYNKTPEIDEIIENCADSCNQEDCNTMMIHISDIYENHEMKEITGGRIILDLDPQDYRREAIRLVSTAKLVWMVTTFASIFFGINFYGTLMKSENSYYLATIRNKKRKRKNKKFLAITIAVTLLSLCLALVLEMIFFDFGREHNVALLRKESIKERSVSVSICYDLCKIIKNEFKQKQQSATCNEEELMEKWTIRELDEMTWNTSDFKERATMNNSARVYPIRQQDFPIPHFFRDFKKCFLIYYDAKNYWPHLAMQRYSRIFISITGNVPHAHFFIEDGHNYPRIESTPTNVSVLHSVVLENRRQRDGCVDYMGTFRKPKDRLIQQCIIEKSLERFKAIPTQITLRIDDYNSIPLNSSDHKWKFYNDLNLFKNLSKTCTGIYKAKECNYNFTFLTHKDITLGSSHISINLTPYIFDRKLFDDESSIIVANRIFSLLIIFAGYSIKEFSKTIASTHFSNIFSLSFQLSRRLFQLTLSLLFLVNFCFLFYCIICHPMIETSSNQHVDDIEPLAIFRFCYSSQVDLGSNVWKVKDLNSETLDFSEIFEKIQIFDDNDKITTELNMSDFELQNVTNINPPNVVWVSQKNNRKIQANFLYIYYVKCYTFSIRSLKNKTESNLNVHHHRLQRLFTLSFSLRNLNKSRTRENYLPNFFIFFNRAYSLDFDWPKLLSYGEFDLVFSTVKRRYQDDFWNLKHPISSLASLLGLSKPIDDPILYLENLKDSFIKEQYATTNLVPLYPGDKRDFPIKNKQFNYYMQFRSIATTKNDYDFTKNTERIMIPNTVYLKKKTSQTNTITYTVSASPLKFQENTRNRYRFVELFLHLFTLISFWFKVDFITFPTSLKKAYPIFKYFVVYFLYFVVDFAIRLFELWFAFVRFLKFKND